MLASLARPATLGRVGPALQARALSAFVDPELLNHAISVQSQRPEYFRNIDIDQLEFSYNEETERTVITHPDGIVTNVLVHMTPFCLTGTTIFGPHGTLGHTRRFGSRTIDVTEPSEAQYELSLSDRSPIDGSTGYGEVAAYFEWLSTFSDKFAEHLASNLETYPDLQKKFSFMKNAGNDVLYDGIRESIPRLDREWKSPDDEIVHFMNLRQNVYARKTQDREHGVYTDVDREIADEYVRVKIPVFNEAGEDIPVPDLDLRNGDVVSCTLVLTPAVYNVAGNIGATIRRRIRNVTRIHSARTARAEKSSPLGNLVQ